MRVFRLDLIGVPAASRTSGRAPSYPLLTSGCSVSLFLCPIVILLGLSLGIQAFISPESHARSPKRLSDYCSADAGPAVPFVAVDLSERSTTTLCLGSLSFVLQYVVTLSYLFSAVLSRLGGQRAPSYKACLLFHRWIHLRSFEFPPQSYAT